MALPLRRHRAGQGLPRRRLAHLRGVPRTSPARPDVLTLGPAAARRAPRVPTIARVTPTPNPLHRTLATIAAGVAALATALGRRRLGRGTRRPPTSRPRRAAPAVAAPALSRIAGADRYATSVAASRAAFPSGTRGAGRLPRVRHVSQRGLRRRRRPPPRLGGAVLLTRPDGIPVVDRRRARPAQPRPDRARRRHRACSRLPSPAAATRYAPTVQRVGGGSARRHLAGPEPVRVRGRPPGPGSPRAAARPTAVVGATAAGAHRSPVIVLDGTLADLPSANAALLRDLGVTSVTVVGSTAAVSARDRGRPAGRRRPGERRARLGRRPRTPWRRGSTRSPGRRWRRARPTWPTAGRRPTPSPEPCSPPARSARSTTRCPTACPAAVRPALAGAGRHPGGTARWRDLGAPARRPARGLPQHRRRLQRLGARQQAERRVPRTLRARRTSSCPSMPYANGHRLRSRRRGRPGPDGRRRRTPRAPGAIGIDTAYRSYATQKALYDKYLALQGPHLDRHLVPAPRVQRAPDRPHGRPAADRPLELQRSTTASTRRRRACGWPGTRGGSGSCCATRRAAPRRPGSASSRGTSASSARPLATGYHDGGWHTYEQFLGQPAAPTY